MITLQEATKRGIVILSPADVILSKAKDLVYSRGIDFAENLGFSATCDILPGVYPESIAEIFRFTQDAKRRGQDDQLDSLQNHQILFLAYEPA